MKKQSGLKGFLGWAAVLLMGSSRNAFNISAMKATLCPIFMEVLLKNQPEGVQLCVKQHTEADFQSRFKARPELEGLIAKMNA